ncbi:MAG TPA: acetylornithine/succinylornithine family transaminase [Methanocorpusculum sp.]|nr:acetylornithine/succinylornithine family transaminase [Methanocorpusculum sp.]HJJ39903.1 acetylornithine/succinylornithine family transaminase [Methanocorpusculum sp.]HJJ49144.1 acetylornithine/succinylornithine family transaminase [Methanocorpusculum sp.]HJJ56802.1 acetylornithine/succinylornithine family transaminase [Methanocorpusculum sp.]
MNYKELDAKYFMPCFGRSIKIVRGKGCCVYDDNDNKYLDLVAGIAVCSTGHCHPKVVKAIRKQAKELIHCSNLYYVPGQAELAEKIAGSAGLDGKVFFGNSGAEANEAAMKLAKIKTGRSEFVSFTHDFHGRTIGSLAVTHKPVIREPFEPLGTPAKFAEYGDLESLKSVVTKDTAAVIFEPIQGETGVIIPDDDFIPGIRDICDDAGALMICDEVQTGMGRTGKWFAFQHSSVKPDIISIAKGIASGLPMGAIAARDGLEFGRSEHGSTFAGGPIACAAGLATHDVISKVLPGITAKGEIFREELARFNPRVRGLMVGFTIGEKAAELADRCMKRGVLINVAADGNIRLVPPLVISEAEIRHATGVINEAADKIGI